MTQSVKSECIIGTVCDNLVIPLTYWAYLDFGPFVSELLHIHVLLPCTSADATANRTDQDRFGREKFNRSLADDTAS